MHAGEIIAGGSPRELKDRYGLTTLEDVFLHLIEERVREGPEPGGNSEVPRES